MVVVEEFIGAGFEGAGDDGDGHAAGGEFLELQVVTFEFGGGVVLVGDLDAETRAGCSGDVRRGELWSLRVEGDRLGGQGPVAAPAIRTNMASWTRIIDKGTSAWYERL